MFTVEMGIGTIFLPESRSFCGCNKNSNKTFYCE